MLEQVLREAANTSGNLIKEYFYKPYSISNKEGINNLVTEVDHKSEDLIINTIQKYFPDHAILTEESGSVIVDGTHKWIIDPIDGTVNFAHGIPLCCVSIGIEVAGKIMMGAVYNPFFNEFFFAETEKGAFLNDQPIKVSNKKRVIDSCLVTGFPYAYLEMPNGPLQIFDKLIRNGVPVRRLGSAAMDLCWVACGRFDGFYEHKLQPWDSAAGFLIVEEAGGKITDFKGDYYSPYQPHLLATNGLIHNELLQIVNGGQLIK